MKPGKAKSGLPASLRPLTIAGLLIFGAAGAHAGWIPDIGGTSVTVALNTSDAAPLPLPSRDKPSVLLACLTHYESNSRTLLIADRPKQLKGATL